MCVSRALIPLIPDGNQIEFALLESKNKSFKF